ncbi:CBS domain-containing protein [Streptomyces sp. NPDC048392]|uniref:CBS domain-containing protein n=1 Tax=Streptomyces sp. NPDC048392 TaxID=3365543 RepID=UPI003716E25F
MTMVRTQPRSPRATPAPRTVADTMETAGSQVRGDITVEMPLSVMASARTAHPLVFDNDGGCTGLLTQARPTAVRDSSMYSDRVKSRDILVGPGPFAPPVTTTAQAEHAMRYRRLGALPVVDEHGNAQGVLAPTR